MRDITLKLDSTRKDKHQITSQGFLVVDANLTRAGVFDYHEDGKLIRELRSPEEVFSRDSLDSMKFAPLTKFHPKEMVDANNASRVQIGSIGENIVKRGDFVSAKVVINDKKEVDEILAKWDRGEDVELSMGYDAEVINLVGEHHIDGHYDKAQTKIRYNHGSIVPKGRAGNNVKLIMDAEEEASLFLDAKEGHEMKKHDVSKLGSFLNKKREEMELTVEDLAKAAKVDPSTMSFILNGEIQRPPDVRLRALASLLKVSFNSLISLVPSGRMEPEGQTQGMFDKGYKIINDTEGNKMFKFKKDSVEAGKFKMDSIMEEVEDSAKGVVTTLSDKVDEAAIVILDMAKEKDELQAKHDEAVEAGKKLQAKNDELSSPTSATVQAMIKERADLEGIAAKLEVKADDEDGKAKDSKTLKVDVIAKVHPEFKADGKSNDYIGARFDAVVEMLKVDKDGKAAATLGKFRIDAEDEKGKVKKDPREKFLDATKGYHKADDK